jgi:excisionase family DNA binding protein
MASEKERLMTTKEVAEFLQMSEVFVTKEAREGRIPAVRRGKRWRFIPESVYRHVKSLETGHSAAVDSTVHVSPQELSKAS